MASPKKRAPAVRFPIPSPKKKKRTRPSSDDRRKLIQNVRTCWIEGVLEKTRFGDVWLDLEARTVLPPEIERELYSADAEPVVLDSGERIADVFRQEGRALLILGAPGSGKTMTLLELAEDLLDAAEADPTRPVPVVVNLASWTEQQPLNIWLVEQLRQDYHVSREVAKRWLREGALLFLLDGLDEVPEKRRNDCVMEINRFWRKGREGAGNGIAVCCNVDEYEHLDESLRLGSTLYLKPLAVEQVCDYLEELGEDWYGLCDAVSDDPVLREMAESPLMVNIMTIAYQGEPQEQITGFANAAAQREHLFDQYIARQLDDDVRHPTYDPATTWRYLSWLAGKMLRHTQAVFHIEGLQPDWLDTTRQRRYWRTISILAGVAFGTVWGWFVGLVWGRLVGLFVGLATVPVVGAVFGAKDQIRIVEERLTWSWKKARRGALGGLVIGVPVGLLFGVMFGLLGGLAFELLVGLLFGLFGGLGIMLFIGLLFGLIGGIDSPAVDIPSTPNQGIRNSLQSGLFALLFFGPIFWLVHVPAAGALFGLFGGLVFGLKAVIQHSVLRYILFRSGVAPLNYAEFLDYTSSRHLTRRVGGGFIFRHRLLMEHFAHGRGGDVWKAKRQLALPSATTAHPTHTGTTRRTRTEASS